MLILAIFIGIIVGAIVGTVISGHNDLLVMSTVFGLAGSIAGYGLTALAEAGGGSDSFIDGPSMLGALIGALVLSLSFNGLHALLDGQKQVKSDDEL